MAKAAAARAALSSLYDLSFNSSFTPTQSLLQPASASMNVPCIIMPSHQADVIARYECAIIISGILARSCQF